MCPPLRCGLAGWFRQRVTQPLAECTCLCCLQMGARLVLLCSTQAQVNTPSGQPLHCAAKLQPHPNFPLWCPNLQHLICPLSGAVKVLLGDLPLCSVPFNHQRTLFNFFIRVRRLMMSSSMRCNVSLGLCFPVPCCQVRCTRWTC